MVLARLNSEPLAPNQRASPERKLPRLNSKVTVPIVYSHSFAIAKSLLGLTGLGTLLFNSESTLFRPVATVGSSPLCQGVARAGVFCLVETDQLWIARYILIALLIVAIIGVLPAISAWFISYSLFSINSGISIPEGGDQVALNLSIILAVASVCDWRQHHWKKWVNPRTSVSNRALVLLGAIPVVSIVLAKLQISIIYFQSVVAKLPHQEWHDGTALYYWIHHPTFGPADWLRPFLVGVSETAPGVAALTWMPLFIEGFVCVACLLPFRVSRWALVLGLFLHTAIFITMGLATFMFAMWAAVIIQCCPVAGVNLNRFSDPNSGAPSTSKAGSTSRKRRTSTLNVPAKP